MSPKIATARALVLSGLAVAATAGGCTVHVDDADPADGTVGVQRQETALVTGRLEASAAADARVYVNDRPRDVVIAPDRSFVIRDIPAGDVTLAVEARGTWATVVVEDVRPAETVEIAVREEGDAIVIVVTRRVAPSAPPREVAELTGAPLEIRANNVCYYLRPGTYERDVRILGNNVTLLGDGCAGRSLLAGSLTIRGNNAVVQDVELRGAVVITGNNARVEDSCSRCFADACYAGNDRGNGGDKDGKGDKRGKDKDDKDRKRDKHDRGGGEHDEHDDDGRVGERTGDDCASDDADGCAGASSSTDAGASAGSPGDE